MKPFLALMGVVLAGYPTAVAQEAGGDRIVVPARNSTRPRKLDVSLMQGSLVVKTYAGKDVIVETERSGRNDSRPTPPGMRRIDMPDRGLAVEEEDNVITVR